MSFLQCVQAPGLQDGSGSFGTETNMSVRVAKDLKAWQCTEIKLDRRKVWSPEWIKCDLHHKKKVTKRHGFESDHGEDTDEDK